MNPKGDGAIRRSLLAKKIFTSLTLLQFLSNNGLGKYKNKRLPEGSLSQGFCNELEGDIS